NRTRCSDRLGQVGPRKVGDDLLDRGEEEHLVLDNRTADSSPELFAMKIRERLAIRSIGAQRLQALEIKQASVNVVGAGFCNDIDDTSCATTKFRAGSGCNNLELLDGVERDVDCRALSAGLLAKEAVVVVTAIEA